MEHAVYLEVGQKRVIAGAVDWPGWCRSGPDEMAALHALWEAGPRYARVLDMTPLRFQPLADRADLRIVERLEGNSGTDFGVPAMAPTVDQAPVGEGELQRLTLLLGAIWDAFDLAVRSVRGRALRKGPRGGGRELEAMVQHVVEANAGYLKLIERRQPSFEGLELEGRLALARQAALSGLEAAVREGVPTVGPRGGTRWTPRYLVRRVAYHVVDHLWEIEDRVAV